MDNLVDQLIEAWAEQRPELDCSALGVVVRVQLVAKLIADSAEASLAQFGLKFWEYDVLSALRRQGPPYALVASDLARTSLLTPGTVTTRINRLVSRGLVRRRRSRGNRRTVIVVLTQTGARTIDAAIDARVKRADEQLRVLTAREREAAASTLRKLLHSLAH